MLIVGFIQWWYGHGWLDLAKRVQLKVSEVFRAFSVVQILQTLFAPWKQIVSYKDPNATIADKSRGLIDNLVSRTIGFFVRIFTLVAALVTASLTALAGVALIVVWPILPLLSIWLLAKGVV